MTMENTSGRDVLTHYGNRETDTQYGGETAGESGVLRVLEYVFDYDELPAAGTTNLQMIIPAGAIVTSATFEVITAFTSTSTTTDLTVGIADADGGATITDADAIFTAAELTQTVIAAAGVRTASSSGAILNNDVSEAVEITVTPTVDDLLTGRARLIVAYQPAYPS